jgi:chemotaxis methyl-accepting protein methylase
LRFAFEWLVQILTRETTLPIKEVTDGELLRPDHVYIMPPNHEMTLEKGALRLWPRSESRSRHLPIDRFFASAAEEQGSSAIGVVLSGTASDGTRGLNVIKEKGGITIAQDERSARYSSMPSSAILSGNVDLVLTPRAIAQELGRLSGHPYVKKKGDPEPSHDGKDRILALLLSSTGVNFAAYRQTMLFRRIQRRMLLNRIEDFDVYVDQLKQDPTELEALHQDILIHVTSFFREPEVFDTLREKVFPELMNGRAKDDPIRVWLPGSSTGEEVYSVAISLFEFLQNSPARPSVQIFGTDVSQRVVEKARNAIFGEELQSTNEELETAKEELQSINEKLITLNEELRHTNLELGEVNNDLLNLLRSVNIPVVMVGRDLRIRRFTPAAQMTLKLIPSEVGRLITDLHSDIRIPDLENQIHHVIDSLTTKEIEVQDKTGRWYSVRIRPYETVDNKISGAILILFDIEESKRILFQKQQAADFANALLETVRSASLLLDGNLRIKRAAPAFYRLFRTIPEKIEGQRRQGDYWNVFCRLILKCSNVTKNRVTVHFGHHEIA